MLPYSSVFSVTSVSMRVTCIVLKRLRMYQKDRQEHAISFSTTKNLEVLFSVRWRKQKPLLGCSEGKFAIQAVLAVSSP